MEIIVIDDLHRFVEQQNFDHLFRIAIKSNVVIAATCRSKMEYKKVKKNMLEKSIPLETIFENKNIIEFTKVSKDVGKNVADKVEISWDTVKFDDNIGSIFMRFWEMERRFAECKDVEKTILRVIKTLHLCGIYEENLFPLEWIKIAAKKDGLEGKEYQWTGWFENLEDNEFITLEENGIRAEEVYLENVVELPTEIRILDVLGEMITTFSRIPDALFRIGNRASDNFWVLVLELPDANANDEEWLSWETRNHELLKGKLQEKGYLQIAIKAYEEALKIYAIDHFPMRYVDTQNNLGFAYVMLGEIEDKAEYVQIAIKAYEALKIYTIDRFPGCNTIRYKLEMENIRRNMLQVLFRALRKIDNAYSGRTKS